MESLNTLRSFLLARKGLEQSSIDLHIKLMSRLVKQASPLDSAHVEAFILGLLNSGRNIRYINQYIVALHYYGEAYGLPELISYPLCKERKNKRYEPDLMKDEEIDKFLSLPNPHPYDSRYWKRFKMWTLFWMLCAYHGCRMGEVARLQRKDIDLEKGQFVVNQKTGSRTIPLSFAALETLREFLNFSWVGANLFPPIRETGYPYLKDMAWQEDFKMRLGKLGIKRPRLVPYSLRHSAGTRWAEEDVSLPKIQKLLGQKQLSTTQKYLHMSMKGITDVIEQDRMTLPQRMGIEIANKLLAPLKEAVGRYPDKVYVNYDVSSDGREFNVKVSVVD